MFWKESVINTMYNKNQLSNGVNEMEIYTYHSGDLSGLLIADNTEIKHLEVTNLSELIMIRKGLSMISHKPDFDNTKEVKVYPHTIDTGVLETDEYIKRLHLSINYDGENPNVKMLNICRIRTIEEASNPFRYCSLPKHFDFQR